MYIVEGLCLSDLFFGKQVPTLCIISGYFGNVSVGTSLLNMYMKIVNVRDGQRVFDEMEHEKVVTLDFVPFRLFVQ